MTRHYGPGITSPPPMLSVALMCLFIFFSPQLAIAKTICQLKVVVLKCCKNHFKFTNLKGGGTTLPVVCYFLKKLTTDWVKCD